ncbi:MAG: AAA family ATPase [Anaerolineales bacterium]|nr:AAA family ATPase [Anaerolineales bacterium]
MSTNDQEIYRPNRIHRFGLTHFKAFNETAFLPIQPITVLAGLNSSGKSSVIDALLLLKQTLLAEKRVARRIVLDWQGPFFEVDSFDEMVYDKNVTNEFSLSFGIHYPVSEQHRQNDFIRGTLLLEDIDYFFVQANFIFEKKWSSNLSEPDVALTVSLDAASPINPTKFLFLSIDENRQKIDLVFIDEEHQKREYYGGPNTWNSVGSKAALSFSYFLPVWEQRENLVKSIEEKELFKIYTVYRDLFQPAIQTIQEELLNNIKYLGPLREAPKRYYTQQQLREDDVGLRGEDAVLLLQRHWNRQVDFVELPENEGEVISWERLIPVKMPLGQAVNEALRWMGMQKLEVEESSKLISANFMTLSNEDTWVTIADVGFGVSQILPVLTHGLLSDTDSILIFEQPEIHLHPRAQARLAELLVCLARTGRRIIIETHSDHLINRLRRVVAEDLSDQLSDLVSIVFVQPPHLKEGAKLEPLRVNEEGIIENWPPGFLAETAEDSKAIIKSSNQKKRR